MARILPTYPNKRLSYPGWSGCSTADGFSYYGAVPTDGSGTTRRYNCSDQYADIDTQGSNQIQYFLDNNWQFEFISGATTYMNYPSDHTILNRFKTMYVDLMDAHGTGWWLDVSRLSADATGYATFATPPTHSAYYTPSSGMIDNYETAFGPALDFIENTCAAGGNFKGYCWEMGYHNFARWLHARTNYCLSQMTMDGWGAFYKDRYNQHMNSWLDGATGTYHYATSGNSYNKWDHIALLDEVIVEVYTPQMATDIATFLPTLRSTVPSMKTCINIDAPCAGTIWSGTHGAPYGFSGGTAYDSGSDIGYWAPQGQGEPNNRCATETAACISTLATIMAANGQRFDSMHMNPYYDGFPVDSGRPDYTWFLQWADANLTPQYIEDVTPPPPNISISRNIQFS